MKLIKVLNGDLKSPFKNFQYEIGREYTCPNFDTSDEECSNGFYATDFNGLSYSYQKGRNIYEVEVGGKRKEFNEFKRRYEKIVIARKLSGKEIVIGLKKANEEMGYDVLHSVFPINPLKGNPKTVTLEEMELLREWHIVMGDKLGSVTNSACKTLQDNVGYDVRISVTRNVGSALTDMWRGVWDNVWDSIWESIEAPIWAYVSSLFPNIKNWNYVKSDKGINPFLSATTLWKKGFVPSFDGKIWRLHSGKTASVVYEW